jgi:nucleotide-binding universal stress UspA family protein
MRESGPILVPLDGSDLAERALPYAVALAEALRTSLVLVTAWQGTDSELGVSFPKMALEIESKAREYYAQYLDRTKSGIATVPVETQVRGGDAGDEIIAAARETQARLLVIATHGRSGVGRWLYGSTAGRLLREAPAPVVAVGPRSLQGPHDGVSLRHVMVPLDGSPLAERAIPVARTIAKALGGRLTFVRAVNWAAMAYPYALPDAYVPQVDQELEASAKAYLRRQEEAVTDLPVEAYVVRAAAADGLMEFVEKQQVDLVVMTTHARAGLARAALGSVADRLLQGHAPVLLVRPED